MKLSRHVITLVAALLLAAIAPTAQSQVRVAVVDLQRALNETEDGRRAKARLKRLFKRRQQALDKQQQELKQLKEEIEQKRTIWNQKKLAGEVERYQKMFVDLQSNYVEFQRELAQQEGRLTQEIVARMQRILRRLGQTEGYTMIVERSEGGVIWVPSNLDLTDIVIQRYNAGEGREGGNTGSTSSNKRSGRRGSSKRR